MKSIHTVICSLSVLFAGVSCMEDLPVEGTAQELGGFPTFPSLPTPSWPYYPSSCNLCGTNSPVVDGVSFYELALDQETANDQQVRLGKVLLDDGTEATLKVEGDILYDGNLANGNQDLLPWEQLSPNLSPTPLKIDSTIYVHQWNKELEKEVKYALKIIEIGETPHWVDWDGEPRATTYRMQYKMPGPKGRMVDLCPEVEKDIPDHLPESESYPGSNLSRHHFVVFAGDRFDPATMTVAVEEKSEGWLNFACWGSATFKMHMNRRTQAGRSDNYTSNWDERQAMLKMYSADYCGDGTVHTMNGHPLSYEDSNNTLPAIGPVESFEALWDENGATCLDIPRYVAEEEISCWQDLPDCAPYAFLGNPWHLASANPPSDDAPDELVNAD